MKDSLTRRRFIRHATAGSAALTWLSARKAPMAMGVDAAKPALLGGAPVHQGGWPKWPVWQQSWEPAIVKVLRSGQWYRGDGGHVAEFETAYAKLLGAKRCLATASGTTALLVALQVMDVDAGDEVIVSPYTFIATYNAILINKALPVFADTDPGHPYHGPGFDRKPDHRTNPRYPAGTHLRHALRHGPNQRDCPQTQARRDRGCLPGLAGRIQRPQVWHTRRPRLFQLPEFQASAIRRRRRGNGQQR